MACQLEKGWPKWPSGSDFLLTMVGTAEGCGAGGVRSNLRFANPASVQPFLLSMRPPREPPIRHPGPQHADQERRREGNL